MKPLSQHEVAANLRPAGNVEITDRLAFPIKPPENRIASPNRPPRHDDDDGSGPRVGFTSATSPSTAEPPRVDRSSGSGGTLQREFNRTRVADAIHSYLIEAAGWDRDLALPAYSRAMYMVDLIAQALAERQAEQGRR